MTMLMYYVRGVIPMVLPPPLFRRTQYPDSKSCGGAALRRGTDEESGRGLRSEEKTVAREGSKRDPVEKARRRLTKAQMELSVAEEEYVQARVRGKQEVEQARLRAAKWLTKTGKRVDRRAAGVVKAEDRLASLTGGEREASPVSRGQEANTDPPQPALRSREQRALDALRSVYGTDGATATEWQVAAKMTEATFLRARKELTERGLVVRDSDARRGAHYIIQEQGHD
jgi:hypothetical protein